MGRNVKTLEEMEERKEHRKCNNCFNSIFHFFYNLIVRKKKKDKSFNKEKLETQHNVITI
jgi:hypothetical protein